MDRGDWWSAAHGVTKSQTQQTDYLVVFHFLFTLVLLHMQGSAELNHWESDCDRKEK